MGQYYGGPPTTRFFLVVLSESYIIESQVHKLKWTLEFIFKRNVLYLQRTLKQNILYILRSNSRNLRLFCLQINKYSPLSQWNDLIPIFHLQHPWLLFRRRPVRNHAFYIPYIRPPLISISFAEIKQGKYADDRKLNTKCFFGNGYTSAIFFFTWLQITLKKKGKSLCIRHSSLFSCNNAGRQDLAFK